MKKLIVAMITLTLATTVLAEDKKKSGVKYKKGKRIDFESLLVEGEGKKTRTFCCYW
jgi:hypothetical protein